MDGRLIAELYDKYRDAGNKKMNKNIVKQYKKCFTKGNCGKKVKVK